MALLSISNLALPSSHLQLVEAHRTWIESNGLDIKGRIYFSSQGVNAQFGGPKRDAMAYTQHLQQNRFFTDLRFSVWPAR